MRAITLLGTIALAIAVFVNAAILAPAAAEAGEEESGDPICSLPADPGPCDGTIPRWFHNSDTGLCEPFTYGGCEGNANNFAQLAECQVACMDICSVPPIYGPCQAAIPKWFFNYEVGGCERFIFGGCAGSANMFATVAECERACGGVTSRCQLPLQSGPCEGDPGWYYQPFDHICKPVPNGWCGTDDNRFATEEECLESCAPTSCYGDVNGDGVIDIFDLLQILASWGKQCPIWNPCMEDLSFNAVVGLDDLLIALQLWGPCSSLQWW